MRPNQNEKYTLIHESFSEKISYLVLILCSTKERYIFLDSTNIILSVENAFTKQLISTARKQ